MGDTTGLCNLRGETRDKFDPWVSVAQRYFYVILSCACVVDNSYTELDKFVVNFLPVQELLEEVSEREEYNIQTKGKQCPGQITPVDN